VNTVKPRGKSRVVTTAFEHPSVANLIEDKSAILCENTAMFSVIAVCGETGFITDVPQVPPGCLLHVDGAQGFGKIPLTALKADLISISAHKIGGIPGVGALYVGRGVRLLPMLRGGNQQRGLRPGTEPTALIAAFGAAARKIEITSDSLYCLGTKALHDKLTAELSRLNLPIHSRNNVPNIVNFSCGVKSEIMLHFLAEHDIYVSSGSSCARGKKSQILPAYGVSDRETDTAIRVSFGWQNTLAEVDKFIEVLEAGIKKWQ
jgi:cysteine desulfurase